MKEYENKKTRRVQLEEKRYKDYIRTLANQYQPETYLTHQTESVHIRVCMCVSGVYLQRGDGRDVLEPSLLIFQVVSLWSLVSLTYLPQFNGLICDRKKDFHIR